MKTCFGILLPLLLLSALPAAVQSQNLVVNGGFEDGNFTGWTLSGDNGNVLVNTEIDNGTDTGITPHGGIYDAALGTVSATGYLSQTLATTAGTSYVLSFWINNTYGDASQLSVSWNGTTVLSESPAAGPWVNIQLTVSATSSSTVLEFGFEDNVDWLGLDDISVEAQGTAGNLVQNGGFETGSFTDWALSGGTGESIVDNGSMFDFQPHSGTYDAVLFPLSGSTVNLSQTLHPASGTIYVVSFWLNNLYENTGPFSVLWGTGTLLNETTPVAGTWTNILLGVSSTTGVAVLKFGVSGAAIGLDDISVMPMPFSYTTANGAITITGYTGPAASVTTVVVPSSILAGGVNLPVTGIGPQAFQGCTNLASLTIGGNVATIGSQAFQGCTNLTSIAIPNNVISIGNSAFYGDTSLASVSIGANGSASPTIGSQAFQGCPGLTEVSFQGNAPTADTTVFSGDKNVMIYYPALNTGWAAYSSATAYPTVAITINNGSITLTLYSGPGGAVTIPGTVLVGGVNLPVSSIGGGAFYGNASLASVTIGPNVTSIGVNAFAFSSLTAVSIPNGLTSIGGGAFAYTPLASVSIPASVTSIGGGAFNLCISLPAITVDASNPAYCSSGPGVLFNKTQTWLLQYPLANTATSYTVPNGVTNIAEAAFDYATHLASISIPASVTNIGGQAFFECFSLTAITVDPSNPAFYSSLNSSVNGVLFDKSQTTLIQYPVGNPATSYPAMPNTLTSIGDYAFYYATNLTTLALPAGLTSIGAQTFGQCFSLAGITLPAGVTNIGYSSFFNCFSLTSITIPNLVTSIPVDLFTYCTNLTNAWIGAGVTSIGPGAFFGCSRLTSVNIPNGVTSIGAQAFQDCNNLPTVTIPATVNSIGDYAFYGDCAKLIPVYVEGNLPASMGVDVFGDPPTIYYLPGATGWATYAVASGVPVAVWQPQMLTSDGSFGVRDNQFGFNINWASGTTVVVEACTNLANSNWFGLQTNTLTGGTFYFSDPQWTNYPVCFYRVTLP